MLTCCSRFGSGASGEGIESGESSGDLLEIEGSSDGVNKGDRNGEIGVSCCRDLGESNK